jgi:Tol biopolymer transport system component
MHDSKDSWQLIVKDLITGTERQVADNLQLSQFPHWSPDGKSILVMGFEKNRFRTKGYKGGVFLVEISTGKSEEVFRISDYQFNPPDDDHPPLSMLEWSPDEASFYYLFFTDRLVKHDLNTGEDRVLYRHIGFEPYILEISPDGNNLLLGIQNRGEKSRLLTMPSEGGKTTEVCTAQETDDFVTAFWSPDGKYIYFIERPEETNLWRVSVAGGKPKKVWNSENRVGIYDIHPDGNQVAFSIRERATEVRVIENLIQEINKVYNEQE